MACRRRFINTRYHPCDEFDPNANRYLHAIIRFRAYSEGVQYWSGDTNQCTIPICLSATVTVPGGIVAETTVITYTYDPLYRLTAADYDKGDSFDYTYDSTGNRLIKEECLSGLECLTTAYAYDIANRLVTVQDGVLPAVSYQWDANGNLLNDGVKTYTYDSANRLSSVTGPQSESSYAYNGMGNRVQQTVDGETTTYTLDLAIGLTQVLADGENAYLYGLGRIAQLNTDLLKTEYFLGDALGSVRQLADESGVVTLVKEYQPYGDVMSSAGNGVSSYGFTGEWTDVSGMVYLRARYYSSGMGRFMTRDSWAGDYNQPMSYNPWLYVYANPIMKTDPSGYFSNDTIAHSFGKNTFDEVMQLFSNTSRWGLLRLLQEANEHDSFTVLRTLEFGISDYEYMGDFQLMNGMIEIGNYDLWQVNSLLRDNGGSFLWRDEVQVYYRNYQAYRDTYLSDLPDFAFAFLDIDIWAPAVWAGCGIGIQPVYIVDRFGCAYLSIDISFGGGAIPFSAGYAEGYANHWTGNHRISQGKLNELITGISGGANATLLFGYGGWQPTSSYYDIGTIGIAIIPQFSVGIGGSGTKQISSRYSINPNGWAWIDAIPGYKQNDIRDK